MELPKARGVLTDIQNYVQPGGPPTEAMAQVRKEEHDALQIGIEAINFKQAWEKGQYFPPGYLLPGETKE